MKDYYFIIAHHGEQTREKVKNLFDSLVEGFDAQADEPFVFKSKGPAGRQDYYGIVFRAVPDEDVALPLRVTECIMEEEEFVFESIGYECAPGDADEPFIFYGDISTGESYCMLSIPSGEDEDEEVKYVSMPFNLGWTNENEDGRNLAVLIEKYVNIFTDQFKYINMLVRTMSAIGKLLY